MKKISLVLMTTMTFALSSLSVSRIDASSEDLSASMPSYRPGMNATIWIQNFYGAPITVKIVNNAANVPADQKEERFVLDNGSGQSMGKVSFYQENKNIDILIGTTRMVGSFTSLKPYINQIINNLDRKNKSVITINPGSYMNPNWNISIIYKDY